MAHTLIRSAVALVAGVFVLLSSAPSEAVELDINGSWQLNLACSPPVTATGLWVFTEDVGSGSTSAVQSCPTFFVDGAIHRAAACGTTPSPLVGQVSGSTLSVPASGYWLQEIIMETPFASPTFGCIDPPVARALIDERVDGVITDDGFGTGSRITGALTVGQVTSFNTLDQMCASWDAGAVCPFTMLRNAVPTGANQTIEPLDGASVTFASVITGGTVSVTALTVPDGAVPANFQLLDIPIFYDVGTTATVAGQVTVCLPYGDGDNDGVVDNTSPPINEADLKILHEESGVFVDRTTSRDAITNTICATVSSLSQFVLGGGPAPTTVGEALVAQQCPCVGPPGGGMWSNHAQYVRCVAAATLALRKSGVVTGEQRKTLRKGAARSTCGREETTRCCVAVRSGVKCKILLPARCAARSGTDVGDGSCVPEPCLTP